MILNKRHTGLVVRNLEQSIQFYGALGLKMWRREKESGHFIDTVVGISGVFLEWAKMKCPDGSLVELLQYHSHPDVQTMSNAPSNRIGCSHIAFTVHDIDHVCEEISKLGGSVVNVPIQTLSGTVKVAYCHDPDGILLEFVQELVQ